MCWFRFDVDAELNKVDDVATAPPAGKKSSKPAVSDTVETAGLCLMFLQFTIFCLIIWTQQASLSVWKFIIESGACYEKRNVPRACVFLSTNKSFINIYTTDKIFTKHQYKQYMLVLGTEHKLNQ